LQRPDDLAKARRLSVGLHLVRFQQAVRAVDEQIDHQRRQHSQRQDNERHAQPAEEKVGPFSTGDQTAQL
jgi:small-conductance mechanosensitive channel